MFSLPVRSAKEAEDKIKKAVEKGETLPTEARFDSNCITPGKVTERKSMEELKCNLKVYCFKCLNVFIFTIYLGPGVAFAVFSHLYLIVR